MCLPCRDSKTEIPNLILTLPVENVGRFDVPVQIPFLIDIYVSFNDLFDNFNRLIILELLFYFQ